MRPFVSRSFGLSVRCTAAARQTTILAVVVVPAGASKVPEFESFPLDGPGEAATSRSWVGPSALDLVIFIRSSSNLDTTHEVGRRTLTAEAGDGDIAPCGATDRRIRYRSFVRLHRGSVAAHHVANHPDEPIVLSTEPWRNTMNVKTRMTAVGGALALAVVLSACASPEGAPAASSPSSAPSQSAAASVDDSHNDADVAFTQNMVVHHEGAVLMADLAVRTASTAEVKNLAERIAAAQDPEIREMQSWLVAWGEQSAADADMGGMDMGGLSQTEAMAELKAVTGVEFDRRFLELMIEHHEGAIEMSESQLAAGSNPGALELAQSIIDAQKAEITEMEQLLQGL